MVYGLAADALTQASNYLAHLAIGKTLTETRKAPPQNQREPDAQGARCPDPEGSTSAGLATLSDTGSSMPTVTYAAGPT